METKLNSRLLRCCLANEGEGVEDGIPEVDPVFLKSSLKIAVSVCKVSLV